MEKLKIDDEEDSDNDSTSEDEIEPGQSYESYQRTYRVLTRSKEIIKRFLKQVQENRFAKDMSMPYFPQPPVYTFMRLYVKDFQQHKVDPETGRKFLDQVRTSWGYGVDCLPPRMGPFIYPIDLNNELGVSIYVDFLKRVTECVIDRINIEAENMGKTFELVSVNKVVGVSRDLYLLTLTIKDKANAGKVIQAEVSMRDEEQLFVCSSCGVQRRPILMSCDLLSSVCLPTV